MILRFVGTCAHDYSPLLNTTFRDALDMDARRSSCALVDGHLLIDCGDHTPDSLRIQGIAPESIDALLLTHLHGDHYNPENIRTLAAAAPRPLIVAAHKDAMEELRGALSGGNVRLIPLEYLHKTEIAGLQVTALPANHTRYPSHYLIDDGAKKLVYATDGAWILYDTLYALKGQRVDLMALDGTVGDYTGDFRVSEHNSIPMIRLMLESMSKLDIYRPDAPIYLTHIAPSLHKPHAQIVRDLEPEGLRVAYDGLEVEI